ncbi:MAG: MFS transporter [Armatimonadota bacterium]|nr:MFS transporter [Armatimonadota bacterium]
MPYYRKNLLILSTTIFLTCVSWNQIIPFLPLFMKELNVGEGKLLGWVGIIFALQSGASIIALPFWGKLGDKYGRKPMAVRAGMCLSAIYFAMSICTTPLQLAILRFLNGALTGFIPSSMALIATNTPEEFAPRSIATAQTASAAGLIIGPVIGAGLAELVGYRISMRISGFAVLLSAILVWLMVKEPNKASTGEETSLLQDFIISFNSRILSSIMLTVMIYGIYIGAINPILALHLTNMNGGHAPSWLAGFVFSLLPGAFILSAHSWSRLGEQRGYNRTIQAGLIGAGACAVALTFVRNVWLFSAIFFIAGIFLAALNPSTGAIICTKVGEHFRGRAYGMHTSANMIGNMIAPLLAAKIGSWLGIPSVFAFVGITALTGAIVFPILVAGWARDKWETGIGADSSAIN